MSIYALPGAAYVATADGFPTGAVGSLGVRVVNGATGATVTARTTAGIAELVAGFGIYGVTLTAPIATGTYAVVWDNAGVDAVEELVVSATPVIPDPGDPAEGALCTLAEVRDSMELRTAETGRDAHLTALIAAASAAIVQDARRQFALVPGTSAKTFHARSRTVSLAPFDLRTVSSVTLDGVALTYGESIDFDPIGAEDGVYTHAYLYSDVTDVPGRDARGVLVVTGEWGFPSVPPAVRRAAVVTVHAWASKAVGSMGDFATPEAREFAPTPQPGFTIPLAARRLYASYRRVAAA